ncbi:Mo-dependent nitrogenase C-terminal domain-containing protein [Tychonema sp. LEGE 07203]|uniref:Mo-dependent nitrogenase C-terminal domain-containing protein n=1 Tax=Tychonema sp. LEGE 07203 TaxID=1828671 RepID=UPI0018803407|nr:Mo-dependent nitrogenase C-terminal domain-containing protein [Tychonema sp. LEGE 07203]MBE9094443.1 Mo-dependent nitrogenase [Tychonema sp. LEGE 07203]
MLLTRPLQAFGAIFRHKPSTTRSTIEQKSSKNYLEGNISPAPNQEINWYIQLEMLMSNAKSSCTDEEITAWLRGLLTIAWADGNFDENEQKMIANLTQDELHPVSFETDFEPIAAEELAAVLGKGTAKGENFLRTAVMVALADGTYSLSEDEVLYKFCTALGHNVEAIESLRHTIEDSQSEPKGPNSQIAFDANAISAGTPLSSPLRKPHHKNVLQPVKDWLDAWEVNDPRVAHFVCKMIPPQCPFERDIVLFGHKIVHIPAMCKINPLYEQLVGMRFRALCYLADDCKEDVSSYC